MKHALDLFSGTGSATKAFEQSDNWEVTTVDLNKEADIEENILNLEPSDFDKNFEFIWASPPCKKFSVAAIGHHWQKDGDNYYPEKKECVEAVRTVYHTLYLIQNLDPDHWFMENPRGMLRSLIGDPKGTVTYCQYGDNRMKPTDLWGNHPDGFEYKSCQNGALCHEPASRGSQTGTQGREDSTDRARVPKQLSQEILQSINEVKTI